MKKIVFLFALLLTVSMGYSQVSAGTSFGDGRWRVGGGIGLGFGNNGYFGVNVSPFVGYMLTNNLEGGMTVGYQYSKNDFAKLSLFSGGPYANYYFAQMFFGRGHYEYYTGNYEDDFGIDESVNESALWLGGGYQSTGKIRFQLGLMYNVLYDEDDSIFDGPLRPFGGVSLSL